MSGLANRLLAALILSVFAGCESNSTRPSAPLDHQQDPEMSVSSEENERLAAIRALVLRRDQSCVPAAIDALQTPHTVYVRTGLHALAQLGNQAAIPAVDLFINGTLRQDLRAFARVAKARLLAETAALEAPTDEERTPARVGRFFKELGLSAQELNAGANAVRSNREMLLGKTVEVFALRELADMACRGDLTAHTSIPAFRSVDFSLDHAAALKLRMAAVPVTFRASTMIEELSLKVVLRFEDSFLIQLAADEGAVAGNLIDAKLMEMDANRTKYKSPGFAALFRVLNAIGDKDHVAVVEPFTKDSNRWVAHYANILLPTIRSGLRKQYAAGY